MNPLVSLIIPCYNHGHYLPEALDSVLAQTYTDWEAIVIDDGSTDNTLEVAQRYAACDGRIRYHSQQNAGLAPARNAGIAQARGEYLAFLDADDAWEPDFLEVCLQVMHGRADLDAVFTGTLMVDNHGQPLPTASGVDLDPDAVGVRLRKDGFFPPCAVLARTSSVLAVGAFDTHLDGRGTEDWDLWLRITATGAMAGIPEPLARYRVSSGSMSSDVERMHRNRMAVLSKHVGPPEGAPRAWPQDKREAYAWAYQAAGVQYITQRQPDEGWQKLAQAAAIWPEILLQPETAYELACWDQPRGYRGQAETLDLQRNAALVLAGLERLFAEGGEDLRRLRSVAFGRAYLSFAMLADQAGRWSMARGYLLRAIGHDPHLLAQQGVARRVGKLMFGQRVAAMLSSLRGRAVPG